MTCVICKHGETAPGKVTVTLQRGRSTIIIKYVPAMVCENCGEFYLGEDVTRRIMSQAEAAVARGTELELLGYAA
jgi:YgiT-type zinc finger domain-containing protein